MTRHRPGLSLTEVLVTLFIMGLGTLAILTLFPLGALNMAQAMRDDRTTQAAGQADAYLRWYYQAQVVEGGALPLGEPLDRAMTDPNSDVPPAFQGTALTVPPVTNPLEPSYPVVVDPMGYVARPATTTDKYWGGYDATNQYRRLPRRNVRAIADLSATNQDKPAALRVCSLLDGLTFDPANGGQPGNGSAVDREYRYNWLWVLQRPVNAARHNVNLTVVVFDKRTHLFVPDKAEFAFPAVAFTPGATSVTVPATTGVVLQKGGWVMDATVQPAVPLVSPAIRHANFYRIASASPNPADSTQIDLELQTPIRRLDGATDAYTGTLVVLGGVADVFERPPIAAAPFANQ